ncbi:MAG: hypothetical protein H7039_14920 [Bryobacteraceae bacterium]|nr:hypothetical protein [Bryobacteraceae bacterium]
MTFTGERVVREQQQHQTAGGALTINVLFTDVDHTLVALKKAVTFAEGLSSNLRILAPVIVPYPLDVSACPVNRNHVEKRLRTIAGASEIPTRIEIIRCRDRVEALLATTRPDDLIVISWKKRWLWDETSRLARRLRKSGRNVVAIRND